MIAAVEPPPHSLLGDLATRTGAYVDGFSTSIDTTATLEQFVTAFYSTRLFRAERWILARGGYQSSDDDLAELVAGRLNKFAAWTIAGRRDNELLMRQTTDATASWFMVTPSEIGTRLCFGSAVIPRDGPGTKMSLIFRLLLGVHILYSRALLAAAARRLSTGASTPVR